MKDRLHFVYNIWKKEYYLKNKEKLFPKTSCSCSKTIYKYYLYKQNIAIWTNLTIQSR